MLRNHGQIGSLILERELGHKTRPGTKDRLQHHVYSSIKCVRSWEPEKTCADTHHGGLFNFAFSTDGWVGFHFVFCPAFNLHQNEHDLRLDCEVEL